MIVYKIIIPFKLVFFVLFVLFCGIIWYYSIRNPPLNDKLPEYVFDMIRKDFVYHFIAYLGLSGAYFLHKGR